jgi:hypothetical protein
LENVWWGSIPASTHTLVRASIFYQMKYSIAPKVVLMSCNKSGLYVSYTYISMELEANNHGVT